jgi:hypothetical protein
MPNLLNGPGRRAGLIPSYNHSDNKCVFLYIVLDFGNTCRGTNPRAMRVKVPHRLSYNQHFLRPRETQHGREFADVENKT